MAKLNYDASETGTLRPFETVNDCLESIEFKLYKDQSLSEQSSFIYNIENSLEPEIKLDVNTADIVAITKVKSKDLILYVAVVNVELKHTEIVYQEGLDKLNKNKFPISIPLTNDEMPIDINIVVAEKSNKNGGNNFNRRGIKRIRLLAEGKGGEFPKVWIEPEEFETMFGLASTTSWHLHWKAQDLDNSIEDLVILYLNTKYHTAISKISADTNHTIIQRQLLSSISAQLMNVVFTKAQKDGDFTQKATKILITALDKKLSIKEAEITKAMQDANSYSFIASWANSLFDIPNELEKLQ